VVPFHLSFNSIYHSPITGLFSNNQCRKSRLHLKEDDIIIPETKTLAILMEMEIEASDVKREKIKMIKNQPKE